MERRTNGEVEKESTAKYTVCMGRWEDGGREGETDRRGVCN